MGPPRHTAPLLFVWALTAASPGCTFDPAGAEGPNPLPDAAVSIQDGGTVITDAGPLESDAGPLADSGTPPQCGDQQIQVDETCDDGNRTDGDGCSADCNVQPGWGCEGEPSQCIGLPIIELSDTTVTEGQIAQILVQLTSDAPFPVRFEWTTEDETATAPDDYTAVSGRMVEIAVGDRTAVLSIQTLSDGRSDPGETLKVSLSNIENARIGDPHAVATIEDIDSLVDTGLLARYFLADAVPDQALPATIMDSSPNPFDLAMDERAFGGPSPVEVATGRGLQWANRSASGRAEAELGTSKIHERLNGVRTATMEAVAHIESTANASRIIHLGRIERGLFSLLITDEIYLSHNNDLYGWPLPAGLLGRRAIFTLVYDTRHGAEGNRLRLYIDGTDQGPANATIPQNTEIQLADNDRLVLGNRAGGGYSFKGRLYYAALYDQALSPDEVAQNVAVLLTRDDP